MLAIIPARGGSKGVPRKNLALVGGKPLVAWTIEAASHAKKITRIVVSTDDVEIADISREYGAEVPFLRPSELAQDDTPGEDVIIHAMQWLEEHEQYISPYVMVLQPTSPLRTMGDIDRAIAIAEENQADGVVSVSPAKQHPDWMKRVTDEGRILNYFAENSIARRRQDLTPAFALNGAIYLARWDVFLKGRTFYTEQSFAYIMPNESSLDIDNPWDLELANFILTGRRGHA